MSEEGKKPTRLEMEILPVEGNSPGERLEWMKCDLPGVRPIHIDNSRHLVKMFHTTFSMTAILRAKAEWFYKGTKFRSSFGSVSIWEPGEFHQCLRHFGEDEIRGGDATATQRGMVIEPETLHGLALEMGIRRPRLHLRRSDIHDPEVFSMLRRFHASLERPSTGLERYSRFAACAKILLERVFETRFSMKDLSEPSDAVRHVRDYIHDRFAEEIRLEDLAREVGLNRFHILRLFKRSVGIPPHQYQIEVRVSRALDLLRNKVSPAAAAASVGFADQSHFTRHLKQRWRVTPGEYARL